jgi:nucleoside-diphosphate-sugar epimerase
VILLTGGNGHLGANLLRRLLSQGAGVRVLLRPGSDNSTVDGLDVEPTIGDLRDPSSLAAATKGIDAIYHCAAQVSTVVRGEQQLFANNVLGTRNLLRAALENGVRRVVVSGSLSAVGHRVDRPTDETEPFNPFERHLPYSVSKAGVEHECLKAISEGLDVVTAISCAILGPNDFKPSRMGEVFTRYANGQLRAYVPGGFEFVAANDIAEGHVLAMQKGRTGQKYIISTQFMTFDDLFDLYKELTGRPKPHRLPRKVMAAAANVSDFVHRRFLPGRRQLLTPAAIRLLGMGRRADITKARTELGYQPTSIAEAVRDAYEWFMARGVIERAPRIAVSRPAMRPETDLRRT